MQATVTLPSACTPDTWLGSSFRFWLLVKGWTQLVAILLVSICTTSVHCVRVGWRAKHLYIGFLQSVPFVVLLSYCFVPTVSKTIFDSWRCTAYELDGRYANHTSYSSYLSNDLSVQCSEYGYNNPEHNAIKTDAIVLMSIWPIGLVIMHAVALQVCRSSLFAREVTPLTRATKFLHRDYKVEWFAWELLDINRRTVLIGWVIFIFDTDREFLRLVVALLVSIASLALLLSSYPCASHVCVCLAP